MEIGAILASGWTSGLNLYATALLLGVAGRLGWVVTPRWLQEPWVLVALGALFTVEFVVDKVPWLDSAWDAVHLVVRPLGGALLSGGLASSSGSPEILMAALGGGFALSAHGAKSSTRALANTSPEPVSNIVLSLGEDGIVVAVVALAVAYPTVAGVLAVLLAIASVIATVVLLLLARVARRRWKARRARRGAQALRSEPES